MKNIILILFCTLAISAYNVGDEVSFSHQNQEFDLCYSLPGTLDNTFSLGDYNGNTNGGDYHVLVIDMSATWCGPCVSLIPLFDDLHQVYSNNEYVELFVALSDLNQPYSCTQWGNLGTNGIPNIIDDSGGPIFNMFNTSSSFPSLVMIDHEMKVYHKEAGYYPTFVSDASQLIDEMLFNMENSLILYNEDYLTINEDLDDGDGILNPGESFAIDFIISNNSFYLDAINVTATISDDSDIVFSNNEIVFGDINVDGSSIFTVEATINSDVTIEEHDLELVIVAGYIDLNGNYMESTIIHPFSIDISLNQSGYPFDTNSEVRSSPLAVDFYNDGTKYIIFGDNNGIIHILDPNGEEIYDGTFPFDTGNQIWASLAAGYIDNDNLIDIVAVSKSNHLYVFDLNGIKLDYNTNQYLIGTPALGNLDDDEDLEIVFGSFSNDAQVFAINIDGSYVEGFPLLLDEKMQKGVALADFNNNGKDDIVLGTDDDNVYLIYDNGTVGFSYQTNDKIRSAPIIVDYNSSKYIIVGSKDDDLYVINSFGELHFSYTSGGSIYSSPTILDSNNGLMIFFGDDEGYIHALDINGNLYDGFPIYSTIPLTGSVIFHDINNDGLAEIIFGDEGANLHILESDDEFYNSFSYYPNFPISNPFAYSSSVGIDDLDNDGDLEIFAGTSGDVLVYDIKENMSLENYWNIYRANNHRNGFYISEIICNAGDINNDMILNILDIVSLVNIIIGNMDITSSEECAADINVDGTIDILDIVMLLNIVIEE